MDKRQSSSDGFLIQQYLEGNTAMLSALVTRYHKIFCEKAYWITKDKELSKDIAQECWIIIINKLHVLKNADSFKSWAFRIVYTKAIDSLKHRNKKSKNLDFEGIVASDEESTDNDKELIQKALLRAILKLPKEKQDVVRLFYAEAYSITEISTFLKIPIGTVKSRLFQAREKLKSILKKINYEK